MHCKREPTKKQNNAEQQHPKLEKGLQEGGYENEKVTRSARNEEETPTMTHNINIVANTSISISTYGTGGGLVSPSSCTILRNTKLNIGMGLRGYVTEQSCMNVSDVCADAII